MPDKISVGRTRRHRVLRAAAMLLLGFRSAGAQPGFLGTAHDRRTQVRAEQLLGERDPAGVSLLPLEQRASSSVPDPSPFATALLRYNSDFPFGDEDGVIWAGRGITAAAAASVRWRRSLFDGRIAPVAFIAENRAFPLAAIDTAGGREALYYGNVVDLPQRFGTTFYGRVDWGESHVVVHPGALRLGLSSATQHWGPMERFPFILGPGAGGFPHLLLETSRPLGTRYVRVLTRLMYGTLAPSPVYQERGKPAQRFASGLIGTIEFADGHLELGGARFVQAGLRGSIRSAQWGKIF
jgi:hypothetical protein